ncbi:MAG: hypothetical protein PHY43_12910 [Verrucomicrobiales bacterium]|nr:hypothetical protein [Verrucomicrobiales bacterium]
MAQRIKAIQADVPVVSDLDTYRQLVELQKQMIQLSQQNKQAKQECDELRAQVVAKASARHGARPNVHPKAGRAFKMLAGRVAVKSNLALLISKKTSPC